ncbi:MAG: copper amine oxidase N-terminal domain-containing protein [Clostridia bacterium]|nr:copper amine oxidase N-terminal domain-containing protein [Clostridia bacterium]
MKKILICLMTLILCFSSLPAYAENLISALPLNQKMEFSLNEENEQWLLFEAPVDSLYNFKVTCEDRYAHIELFDKTGGVHLTGSSGGIHSLAGVATTEITEYLHKGQYYIRLTDDDFTTIIATKIDDNPYMDAEPNDMPENAKIISFNDWQYGCVDGFREDASRDESDLYVLDNVAAGTYGVNIESLSESIWSCTLHFYIIKDSGEAEFVASISPEYNPLEEKFKINSSVDLPSAGQYYLKMDGRYDARAVTNYKFMISNGGNEVGVYPKTQTASTPVGVKLNWDGDAAQGYKIYRAAEGGAPELISGVIYGNSFVDVTVNSNTKYYYMIVPEGLPQITEINENAANTVETETILQPENAENKGFILMQIGKETMLVGEQTLEIDPGRGTVPIIQNGRTLVPIRAIIEAMGGSVDWNDAERKITLNANGHTVVMRLGEKEFTVDGQTKQMDIAPDIINDRTMLPICFAAENLGCQVEWINSSREIVIVF